MPLVGTAGHVDHGKSTLVEALTGRDPDRWAAEKERGLTIDLGFAWTTLPSGTEVSFVDVPGHERFMKNMLAGVDGFEAALLVVAADEGWSAQTTEHVAALDALDIRKGVVAITKVDAADSDLVELAGLDVLERLDGTGLAGVDVVPVSAREGTGLDRLRDALDAALVGVDDRSGEATRLWVDRVFAVAGAGTVVTGSLSAGRIATGDELELLPSGQAASVRGVHRHDQPADRVSAGTRAAVNLTGVPRDEIRRGNLLSTPGTAWEADRLLVSVRPPPGGTPPTERGAYHLHIGTGAWTVDLRPVDPGSALLVPDAPIPARVGDRFVLRDVGRQRVAGGGRVLDPAPPRRRARAARSLPLLRPPADTAGGRADALLEARGRATPEELSRWSGGGTPSGTAIAGTVYAADTLAEVAERLRTQVDEHHAAHPLRPGLPKAEAASACRVDVEVVEAVAVDAGVEDRGAHLARPDHEPGLSGEMLAAWREVERRLGEAGPTPPRADELGLDPDVLHLLVRDGDLVRVGPFAYLPSTLDDVVAEVDALGDGWSVADFRDHLGISRKHAVPLLEWLDETGVTRRRGDVRVRR